MKPRDPLPRLHRRGLLLLSFVAFSVVSLAAYWPIYPGDSSNLPSQASGDIAQTVWFLKWTQYAVFHGSNLFYSNLLNVPYGVNTAQNTQVPLLGLVTAPLTYFISPVSSYNLMMWLAFPLSAISATFVLSRWVRWFPAALFGGVLYGFGPYVVGAGVGHLNLSFVPFPPLIIMAAYELFALGKRPIYWGLWLGVFMVLQFYISPEVLSTSVLIAAISLFALALLRWRSALARIRLAIVGIVVALLGFLACTAIPIWFIVAGPNHYQGPVQGYVNPLHADLLGAIMPTLAQRLYPASWKAAGSHLLQDNWDENGSFLGVPLLLLWSGLTWRFRRNRWLLFVSFTVPLAYLVSLGPELTVGGHNTSVSLPFKLISRIPALDNILPSRMSVYVMLAIAIAVALGVDDWRNGGTLGTVGTYRWSAEGVLIGGGSLLTLLSLLPGWPYANFPIDVPSALTGRPVLAIPSGTTVLAYPYPTPANDEAMLWQALANMRYKLIGGYALVVTSGGGPSAAPSALQPYAVESLLANDSGTVPWPPLPPAPPLQDVQPTEIMSFLDANSIGAIILERAADQAGPVGALITEAVGRPRFADSEVEIWVAPRSAGSSGW